MQQNSIFEKIKEKDFYELLGMCPSYSGVDKKLYFNEYKKHVENHLKKERVESRLKALEGRWYRSLSGQALPDYSVYNDPFYICDIWLCWTTYSRKGLLSIRNDKSLVSKSIVSLIGDNKTIVDLGCGFGYTTAGLKELFKNSRVFGTNLKTSYQFNIAKDIGDKRGFEVIENTDNLPKIDVVFASEYFEHIMNPIEHMYKILKKNPKYLIIANGFNGMAIGHFNYYEHIGKKYSASNMNIMFNKSLKMLGYEKIKTKIWNNRPAFWIKK